MIKMFHIPCIILLYFQLWYPAIHGFHQKVVQLKIVKYVVLEAWWSTSYCVSISLLLWLVSWTKLDGKNKKNK